MDSEKERDERTTAIFSASRYVPRGARNSGASTPYEKIVGWSIIAGEGEREKENKSDMRKEERQGIQNKVKWIERKMKRGERKEKYTSCNDNIRNVIRKEKYT